MFLDRRKICIVCGTIRFHDDSNARSEDPSANLVEASMTLRQGGEILAIVPRDLHSLFGTLLTTVCRRGFPFVFKHFDIL